MKKFFFSILLTFIFAPSALAANWWIDSYSTDIQINTDSTLTITETITANFSQEEHHGIYLLIPTTITKEDDKTDSVRFDLISVTDENKNRLQYQESRNMGDIEIKIGDPNTMIQEPKTYVVKYEISNGLDLSSEDHDQIYWNVISSEWEVPILKADAELTLPSELTIQDQVITECYAGFADGAEENCTYQTEEINKINFWTNESLNPYEGLTILVTFPKGLVSKPATWVWIIKDYWPAIIVPIVFIIMFMLWRNYGKDKKVETIIPEYEPPKDITPIEASILIDDRADIGDISAIMIDLAIRGFIKIEETEDEILGIFNSKEYILHRINKPNESSLKKFEQMLIEAIFETEDSRKLSDLKNKFYKKIPELTKEMFASAMEKKLFVKEPHKTQKIYFGIGLAVIFIGGQVLTTLNYNKTGLTLGLSLMAGGLIIIIFSFYMPKKTDVGNELYRKLLGLKMYIETAEKDRIKFHEKEKYFERLLPYAMIFRQTDHWAKQFEDIYKTPPSWYSSHTWGAGAAFSLGNFTHNLDQMSSSMKSTMQSSPGGHGGHGGHVGGGAW